MLKPAPTLTISCRRDGSRIRITGEYAPENVAFINKLPGARYWRGHRAWTCTVSPLTCWLLRDAGAELDKHCDELATAWEKGQEPNHNSIDAELFKTTPWQHQIAAMEFCEHKRAAMLALRPGCVDAETEYLSRFGWRPISQYCKGEIAQYNLDADRIEFVEPLAYIKKPCEGDMLHFKHCRGMDMMLTEDHRVLGFGPEHWGSKPLVHTALDYANRENGTQNRRILTASHCYDAPCMDISDEELRVQVAVIADGHFPARKVGNLCRINVKKNRKKDRLELLLDTANIPFTRHDRENGYAVFHFEAPMRCKSYGSEWWNCDYEQRQMIADECIHWDGSAGVGNRGAQFFTTIKESADFIQWCFVSTGKRASIHIDDREGKPLAYVVLPVGNTSNYITPKVKNGNVTRVPSPDGMAYCFTVPSSYLILRRNNKVFITGNCGKSLTAVGLAQLWQARKVLILCPKSVMGVWRREFEFHYSGNYSSHVLDQGSGLAKNKALVYGLETARNNFLNIFVINYESTWRDPVAKTLSSQDWDLIVADESQRIASAASSQGKFACQLAERSTRRLALTGTPMPSSILNIFGQYKFLDPAIFGSSFTQFRARYAVTHEEYKSKVLETINEDEFIAKFKLLAFGTDTADVLDLPPITYQTIPVTLTAKTEKAYKKMLKESYLELESGEVTAQNAGVKLLRLAQIASGHLKNDNGEVVQVGDEKQQALKDLLIDMPGEKVVVFCRFTADLRAVEDVAKQLKLRYGEISGARKDLTAHATMPEGIDILGVQERAGGVGIDLTRARIAVDYSRGYSLGDYEQKIARLHRPGQDRPVLIKSLVACGTCDEAVVSSLANKKEAIGSVLEHVRWRGKQA